ncbi:hypothetical protein R5R35_009527 [Gryllus longicercus]|uniref:Accessory gland protein n=1 Tax=Gryllus longicercus TaxID=2509291 RepID=A0AAN9VU89_9ORTH
MAVIATIIGILALTAAAHYYYSTYNNEQPEKEYYESYNRPQYQWNVPHNYHNEENSIDMLPDLSKAQESTTIKTAQNGLVSDHTLAYEIKSSTSQDETTLYSTDKPQSTSTERGNEIGNAIGLPHVVNKKTLKSKKYYKYKANSKTKPDQTDEFVEVNPVGVPDPIMGEDKEKDQSLTTEYADPSETSTKYAIGPQTDTKNKYYNYKVNSENKLDAEVEFVDVDHAGASDPIMEKDKGNPSETRSTEYSIPSKGSTILGHFFTIVIMAMAVLP